MNAQLDLLDLGHPEMPTLDLSRVSSRPVSHLTAARMVEEFHYAHRVPSIVLAVGMYVDDVLAGVLTYGIPPNRSVCACCGEERVSEALELNRLFIHDWSGRNSESWLIGQSFRWLADREPGCRILVSYADQGAGHVGGIYRATNWLYTGSTDGSGGGSASWEHIVNGARMHSKAVFERYGTRRREVLTGLGLTFERLPPTTKHRYVQFLGDRRQKRELRQALRWPVLPYPKAVALIGPLVGALLSSLPAWVGHVRWG